MICDICKSNNWHIRDDLNPGQKVGICKDCGFVAHIIEPDDVAKITEFYRKEYRSVPTVANIITTTHKLNFIKPFITDWLKDKKGLTIADIGAATGYLCDWFRRSGHKVTGTELTTTFRRFSEHYYGIPLTEQLTDKHKFDLIVYYHTLEHIPYPVQEIAKNSPKLAEKGHIMVSAPEWFSELENLAQIGALNIANYFHKNHVNCFSRNSMKNLFNVLGFKVIKQDFITYGQTYLIEYTGQTGMIEPENWQEVNTNIDKIKASIEFYNTGKIKEAIDTWYNFPEAHLRLIFDVHKKDTDRQKYEIETLLEKMPENRRVIAAYATWLYQNQQFEEALKQYDRVVTVVPSEDTFIFMGWCLERLGKYQESTHCMRLAMQMNPNKWAECTNWICHNACQMPTWDEKAIAEVKENMLKQTQPTIELKEALS